VILKEEATKRCEGTQITCGLSKVKEGDQVSSTECYNGPMHLASYFRSSAVINLNSCCRKVLLLSDNMFFHLSDCEVKIFVASAGSSNRCGASDTLSQCQRHSHRVTLLCIYSKFSCS
jgi:hypothetical protein